MQTDFDRNASGPTRTIHGYVALDTTDPSYTEAVAWQAVKLYAQAFLGDSEVKWHVDQYAGPMWDHPFPGRPAAAKLIEELRPGDILVFASIDHSAARLPELRRLIGKWLSDGVQVHFANCHPMGSVTADQMGPLSLLALQVMARFHAGNRQPRKTTQSWRRTSGWKANPKNLAQDDVADDDQALDDLFLD